MDISGMTLSYLVHQDFYMLYFLQMGVHLLYRIFIDWGWGEPRIMVNIYQKGHQ